LPLAALSNIGSKVCS